MKHDPESVVTFRLGPEAREKLSALAKNTPRLVGEPDVSRHQVARSILLEALDGKERNTTSAIAASFLEAAEKIQEQIPDEAWADVVGRFCRVLSGLIADPYLDNCPADFDKVRQEAMSIVEEIGRLQHQKAMETLLNKD